MSNIEGWKKKAELMAELAKETSVTVFNNSMNQLEKEQKLAALKTQQEMLEDEIRALEAIPVKQEFKVWEPVTEQLYWKSCRVQADQYYSTTDDARSIEAGLAHPTKEAAERHHEFLKMLRELEKFAVEHNEGWKPDFMTITNSKFSIGMEYGNLCTTLWYDGFNNVLPYFKTRQLAQKAIDTFGDRLKILFEYYNS